MSLKNKIKTDWKFANNLILAFLEFSKIKIKNLYFKIKNKLRFFYFYQFIWFLTRKELFPFVLFFVLPPLFVLFMAYKCEKKPQKLKCKCLIETQK